MAINLNDIANKTMKLMQGSGHKMRMFDASSGKSVATPDEARFFYVKDPNMMVQIDDNTNELKFHIGEDVDIDNPEINNMMNQLKSLARTNMLDFDIRSFGKHIEPKNYAYKVKQNQENTMNDLFNEGMGPLSGSSRTSRQTLENVRLILKHRAPVNEESRGSRSRNISAIFVETGEGERFKYPFLHLNGARAMARHIASGGETHDMVGEAIVELSSNLAQLKEFTKIVDKQQLVNENNRKVVLNVRRSMNSIKEKVQRIQGARGYAKFVEGIALKGEKTNAEIPEETLDSYVQKFTKSSFEESLKDILPLVHRVNEDEEEMTDRRDNQTARVKEIMSATVRKTGERVNTITFGEPSNPAYDYDKIKTQFAEPRTPEEAAQHKISKIALTFDGLADRVTVDTLKDKGAKKKGHDLAAEISFFLTDIADAIRSNPRGIAKDDMQVAGQLLKMSKASVETVEPKSADTRISEMLEEAFSKFDSDKVLIKENTEAVSEDIYDDGKLRLDPKTGKYDPEEVKQMQQQGAEMARQKANQNMRDKLNRDIDVSQKAHTITVDYDLELDTPKSKNPLLKKHYQLMKKFNVFISMPEWEEGPPDSGFGQWFANVRGSKENLKGWLKAWEYDYDERDYEDMGLGESATQDDDQVRMRHLAGVTEKKNEDENVNEDDAELKYSMKKPTLDDLIQMSNEADYEMGDVVVFGMKNHPAYRFDLQSELKDYMERVRVGSTHSGTDHSGYLNMKVSEIADNIDGMAIVAVEDGGKVKSLIGWSSEDEINPPKTDDEQSGEDEDGAFASGPDNDQVKMRHLAGLDDF